MNILNYSKIEIYKASIRSVLIYMTNQDNSPLISVIVPVYNTEQYLEKCIKSILTQTYNNIELILVNDGSTDNSGDICDVYAKNDSRIIVIHKENGGQSTARNEALEVAKGKYIGFVDSDDYISENMYKYLMDEIISTNAQVSVCGRYNVSSCGMSEFFTIKETQIWETETAVKNFLMYNNLDAALCDKLIYAKLFENLRFPSGYICEDVPVAYQVIATSNKIVHCGKPLYYYLQRQGSTSRSGFSEKTIGLYMYHKQVCNSAIEKYPNLVEEANSYYFKGLLNCYLICERSRYRGEQKRKLVKEIKKNYNYIKRNKYIPIRLKHVSLLVFINVYPLMSRICELIRGKLQSCRL